VSVAPSSVHDVARRCQVVKSTSRYESGRVISVRTDAVRLPGDEEVQRDVVSHPGAVGVVCLDGTGRVLLLRQYRHCVSHELWEPPAGLLDRQGEDPRDAAARELVEEAGWSAGTWSVLVDAFTSPGMTDESVRIYLARDLTETGGRTGEGEERDMPISWVPLDEAVGKVLAGELHNPMAIMGILATAAALSTAGLGALRPADASWPARLAAKQLAGS
jgi:8-oxo-dGTP pyrophosphatase MutT (NUDIX family)